MKLGSIQFLRTMAVILIVYANAIIATNAFGKSQQASFHYLSSVGFIGMDLFFVISGFVISFAAGQYSGLGDGLKFLQQRFFRINPVYYIASLLFWVSVLLQNWYIYRSALVSSFQVSQSAIDTLLIVPATDAQYLYSPFLPITWTLAFIWLSYLLYFITILCQVKRKIWLMAGCILGLSVLWHVILPTDLRVTFVLNPILLEFLLGMIIYQVSQQINRIPVFISFALLLTGLTWLTLLVFYNNPNIAWAGNILSGILSLERFLYWGIPSSCLIAGCVFLEKEGRFTPLWNNRLGQILGDASYSIFLIHLFTFNLLYILYKKVGFLLPSDVIIFLQVLVGLGIGLVFFRWVEKPLSKWLNNFSQKAVTVTSSLPGEQPQATRS